VAARRVAGIATAGAGRDPVWTESIGVGDRKYLSRLKNDLGVRGYGKYMAECNETLVLRDCGNP
jgi:hypothetical protein